jgi:hypothetical protein
LPDGQGRLAAPLIIMGGGDCTDLFLRFGEARGDYP